MPPKKFKKRITKSKAISKVTKETESNRDLTEHNWDFMIDTGSTLLNLNISGGRSKTGGLPGGAFLEIYGPSSLGKTALACAIGSAVSRMGGKVKYIDPEGRLDQQYAKAYGLLLSEDKGNYVMPNTVAEMFNEHIMKWDKWAGEESFTAIICDGVSALTTDMEMEGNDKYGGKRAKDFSEGCRKSGRIISGKNRLLIFTSQVREKMNAMMGDKETTSCGRATEFYASVRIRIGKPAQGSKITRTAKIGSKDKEIKKTIGICSDAYIKKSSVDDPFRQCYLYLIFGYGLDDIRSNLTYNKTMMGEGNYVCGEKLKAGSLEKAIIKIEKANNEDWLRKRTIKIWNKAEDKLTMKRKPKVHAS